MRLSEYDVKPGNLSNIYLNEVLVFHDTDDQILTRCIKSIISAKRNSNCTE